MTDFIFKYWLQVLFTAIVGFLATEVKAIKKRYKKKAIENQMLIKGVRALLYERLIKRCDWFTNKEFIYEDELEDITELYNSYHELGGNGTGTQAFEQLKKLKVKRRARGN